MNKVNVAFASQIRGCKGNPTFKHITTGLVFSCRKDAVVVMGTQRYKKALRNMEFVFHYELKDGEQPIRITY
ncbi:MAG: hypothetical protein SPH22_06035 [Prevotella sp.]|nr:hypothetical protein [Prevotella sp.]MDY4990536.1 hypothetical protein [Prevotella sp.]MDY5289191.1 hypothetical protein [Prevotella sp.]